MFLKCKNKREDVKIEKENVVTEVDFLRERILTEEKLLERQNLYLSEFQYIPAWLCSLENKFCILLRIIATSCASL